MHEKKLTTAVNHVPLKCNGCTACCRGKNAGVLLTTEDIHLVDDYPDTVDAIPTAPPFRELVENGQFYHRIETLDITPEQRAELRARGITHMCFGLKRKPNGDCIHLNEHGCAIYERRPFTCRDFDCRRYGHFNRAERRHFMKEYGFGKEVFEAGRTRLREAQAEIATE